MAAFQKHAPSASQTTKNTSRQGANKPIPGGKSGAGKARGQAPFKSATSGTLAQPGAMSLSAGQDKFARQNRKR